MRSVATRIRSVATRIRDESPCLVRHCACTKGVAEHRVGTERRQRQRGAARRTHYGAIPC
eukprot:5270668-Pleurochrysis_carterae.AAC.1